VTERRTIPEKPFNEETVILEEELVPSKTGLVPDGPADTAKSVT
jgi:hypothetical protein